MFGVFERLLSVAEFAQVNLQFGGIDFGAFMNPGVLNGDGGRDDYDGDERWAIDSDRELGAWLYEAVAL